jgi:adenylate cyclase
MDHQTTHQAQRCGAGPSKLHIICEDGTSYDYTLSKEKVSIGRGRENDLVFFESGISRNHAEIVSTPKGHEVIDLGSSNGTIVNGSAVSRAMLVPDDVIEIAGNKIIYVKASDTSGAAVKPVAEEEGDSDIHLQKVVATSPHDALLSSHTLLVSVGKTSGASQNIDPTLTLMSEVSENPETFSAIERTNKVLFVLYEISRQLHVIHDFNILLEKIMDLVFVVIDADYGFIVLTGSDKSIDLEPVVVKYRDERTKNTQQIRPSKTIIERVIKDKVALLTSNAMGDSRFDAARSILIQKLRSAICVPLWKKGEIIGIIQLDSVRMENLFTHDDLELLKAIGSQVSMIIEQASLNEKIREEERMRRQLERFHSPQVVEMILHSGQDGQDNIMEPHEVTATILFSDIIGFTSLSEQMPARDITAILNRYFSRMTDIVFKHDGTLDKYIGDGLMAVFGAPIEKEDDALRAVRAAREMREALADLRDDEGSALPFQIRIGVNTGRIVSANIGSLRRMEYTVIGDPVNTASRLESLAQPNQILIGEETFRRVKDTFTIHAAGPRKVKGKAAEIMVYEVL